MSSAWIGVDFDGTIAHYEGWNGGELGKPIPKMVERVKRWIAEGKTVKIFTARVGDREDPEFVKEQTVKIKAWCLEHVGRELEVTATKDYGMMELWDDRAVQVKANTGEPVGYSTRGLD